MTATITVEIHNCERRRSYMATFTGPRADDIAADFLTERAGTHTYSVPPGEDLDVVAFPRTAALVFPVCHHGMSAWLCMDPDGPHHWGTREQEMLGAL